MTTSGVTTDFPLPPVPGCAGCLWNLKLDHIRTRRQTVGDDGQHHRQHRPARRPRSTLPDSALS